MLPATYGNLGPRYRTCVTLPPGPRRVVDGGERPRFHVATLGKAEAAKSQPGARLRRCRRILVVKLDFIGDWVLTTPFLDSLRRNAPLAEITAVVLDRVFDLAATCPFVDRAISVSRADHRRVVFAAAKVEELATFRRDYQGQRFDLALVPRWDADFNGALQVAFGSRAPAIIGFSECSATRRGILNRGDDRFYSHAIVDRRLVHEADRDLALIEALGGQVTAVPVRADFTAADANEADRFLNSARVRANRFLVVAPFGSKARSTLPAARLARIVRRLAKVFDLGLVVIGGPREADRAAAFTRDVGHNAVSAAGILGMRPSAALIARAGAFIGMDSGPAHIAAAVGTPVAVLSCHPVGGVPDHANAPERFAPRGSAGVVVVIRPARATAPCRGGCTADEAHCILALDETVLWPQLADFVERAVGISPAKAKRSRPNSPGRRRRRSGGDKEVRAG
jgi:heptosyltransferase-3